MTPSRWALAGLWRDAREAFHADWRALAPETRRRVGRTLGVGLLAVLALTAVVSLIAKGRLAGREAELEAPVVRAVADWPWPSFHMSIWLEEPGGSVMLVPLVLLAAWTAARLGRSRAAIALVASFLGAKAILLVGRLLFQRARPDLIAGGIAAPGSESFPSGHTLQAVCVWGTIGVLWWRASRSPLERELALVLGVAVPLVVATARLRLGTHWPSDLAAGGLFGVAWVVVIALATAPGRLRPRNGRYVPPTL